MSAFSPRLQRLTFSFFMIARRWISRRHNSESRPQPRLRPVTARPQAMRRRPGLRSGWPCAGHNRHHPMSRPNVSGCVMLNMCSFLNIIPGMQEEPSGHPNRLTPSSRAEKKKAGWTPARLKQLKVGQLVWAQYNSRSFEQRLRTLSLPSRLALACPPFLLAFVCYIRAYQTPRQRHLFLHIPLRQTIPTGLERCTKSTKNAAASFQSFASLATMLKSALPSRMDG